jgi:hypothetical protein
VAFCLQGALLLSLFAGVPLPEFGSTGNVRVFKHYDQRPSPFIPIMHGVFKPTVTTEKLFLERELL